MVFVLSRAERGVSPVVGAVLVLGIVSMAIGIYVQQVVPGYLKNNEASFMHEARDAFLRLQSLILNHESGEIEFPMSADPAPLFSPTPQPSLIEVHPACWIKRIQPTDDAYVDEGSANTNYGGAEILSVRSYQSGNRYVFLKFDVSSAIPDIDPNSLVEAWLVLYCENISKFTGWPWNEPPSSFPQYDEFYLPDLPLKVEACKVLGDWDESTITWNNKPELGETIKESAWPYADNHTIKDNEAWFTWDVTTWVRERMEAGQPVSICLKPAYENATQERYANFSSKERGDLPVVEPPDVPDPGDSFNGYETDKTTGHPPYLKPHLTLIYENGDDPGPPVSDEWGPILEDGYIRIELHTYEYPEHDFVFESGAVLQQQWGRANTIMISDPGILAGMSLEDNDAIVVVVNRYRIVNWDRMASTSDVRVRVRVWENTDYRIEPTDTDGDGDIDPNRENLLITIVTPYEWPWKYYLRDKSSEWNSMYWNGGLADYVDYYYDTLWTKPNSSPPSGNICDFQAKLYVDKNTRLYIWGRIEDPSVKDIYYYDRTFDVEVKIGV